MQIVIPLNGIGRRFSDLGYKIPKPLIKVLGKELILHILDSLSLASEKVLLICNRNIKKYRIDDLLRKEYNNDNIQIVYLESDTKGAAETVLIGLDKIEYDPSDSLLILDGDTVFDKKLIDVAQEKNGENVIFYNINTDTMPIYSYISDINEEVIDIQEKEKISDKICIGAYLFGSIEQYKNTVRHLIYKNIRQKGEFYISGVYKQYCIEKKFIRSVRFDKYHCLGTPLQLQNYAYNNNSGRQYKFVVDIDNTLQSFPLVKGDYSTVLPINETIEFIKNLKEKGHYIILHTARRMKTHNGNIGKVVADISEITISTLKTMGIPYDEIIFGKPEGDFYIDDKALNCFEDFDKNTGFYFNNIKSRPYHNIVIDDHCVEKTGNLEGECFWYTECPEVILKKYFPTIHLLTNNKIIMDRIKGINLSYVYVGGMLTEKVFDKIIQSLEHFHDFKNDKIDFNTKSNYSEKLKERWEQNYELYQSLDNSDYIYDELLDFFNYYETGRSNLIHGDPVFSNIFYDIDNQLKFIDVRGKQGNNKSLYGDGNYDWAKIYQSICGYDYILLDKYPDCELIENFKSYISSSYSDKFNNDIKNITKSLLFSLLPLHSDKNKIKKYYELIKSI